MSPALKPQVELAARHCSFSWSELSVVKLAFIRLGAPIKSNRVCLRKRSIRVVSFPRKPQELPKRSGWTRVGQRELQLPFAAMETRDSFARIRPRRAAQQAHHYDIDCTIWRSLINLPFPAKANRRPIEHRRRRRLARSNKHKVGYLQTLCPDYSFYLHAHKSARLETASSPLAACPANS